MPVAMSGITCGPRTVSHLTLWQVCSSKARELLPGGAYFSIPAKSELETAKTSQPCKRGEISLTREKGNGDCEQRSIQNSRKGLYYSIASCNVLWKLMFNKNKPKNSNYLGTLKPTTTKDKKTKTHHQRIMFQTWVVWKDLKMSFILRK